jgi:hypothetical protein
MWYREYRDYKPDEPLVKEKVGPGKGIVGCEMHEINGWGNSRHIPKKRKKGLFGTLLESFFQWFKS